MRSLFLILCFSLPLLVTAQTTSYQTKVAEQVRTKLESGQPVSVCVLMHEQADISGSALFKHKKDKATYVYQQLVSTAYQSQRRALDLLRLEQVYANSLFIVNAIAIEDAKLALLQKLADLPEVAKIVEDPWVFIPLPQVEQTLNTTTNRNAIEWGIEKIGANLVWDLGYTGQGITIGGADTGYDWDHPVLMQKYRGYTSSAINHNYNWYDAVKDSSNLNQNALNPCGFSSVEPCDDQSHGTHTMGTMVGDDGLGNQVGVAPGAKWVGCRNMDRGWGRPSTYLGCFEWFLAPTNVQGTDPDPARAPHVINNSWYCADIEGCDQPGTHEMLRQAIINLKTSGVVVVISNGNNGPFCGSTQHPPAYFQESFSIGATNIADTIAGFSSRGPVFIDNSNRIKPNVSAPGAQVRSCTPNGGFASFSGTSMAGPHVAGLVALMISANPALAGQVDTIERMIEETAVSLFDGDSCGVTPPSALPNNTHGFGRINALAAVQRALTWQSSAISEPKAELMVQVQPTLTQQNCFLTAQRTGVYQIRVYDGVGNLYAQYIDLNLSLGQTLPLDLSQAPKGMLYLQIGMQGQIQIERVMKIE